MYPKKNILWRISRKGAITTANYNGTFRSSYFQVENEDTYESLKHHLVATDGVEFWDQEKGGAIYHAFGGYGSIIGYAGPFHGNIGSGLAGSLYSIGGVGHDEIHFGSDELIDDGGAVGLFTLGVLYIELNLIAQLFGEELLKTAGGLIQGVVLNQLNNADLENLFAVIGRGGGRIVVAAGSKAGDHETGGSCR